MPRKTKHHRATFEQDPLVTDWLANVSAGTRPSYSLSLLYFCAFTKKTPRQLIEDEQTYRQQPVLNRDSSLSGRHRLQQFRQWLLKDHPEHILIFDRGPYSSAEQPFTKKTRATISRKVGCIKSFYSHYEVPIPQLRRFTRTRRQVGGELSTSDIAKILEHADTRTKALILVGATTGRSTSDLVKLRIGDIDREKFPNWGFIYNPDQPRQKTGIEMISWITPEAMHHLNIYLSERSNLTSESYLFVEAHNDQERPLSKNAAGALLRRLASKVFPNRRKNPISLRTLRSWFGTQLDHNRGGYTHKQILMSHSVPYGGAYTKPTVEELFESVKVLYNEGYTRILAGPEQHDFEALEDRIREELNQEMRKRIKDLEELFNSEALIQEQKETQKISNELLQNISEERKELARALESREKLNIREAMKRYLSDTIYLHQRGEIDLKDDPAYPLLVEAVGDILREEDEAKLKKKDNS